MVLQKGVLGSVVANWGAGMCREELRVGKGLSWPAHRPKVYSVVFNRLDRGGADWRRRTWVLHFLPNTALACFLLLKHVALTLLSSYMIVIESLCGRRKGM